MGLCRGSPHSRKGEKAKLCPNLLAVNSQIHNEAAPILYHRNNLVFRDPYTFDRYMRRMKHSIARPRPVAVPSPLDMLTHITFFPTECRGEQILLFRIDGGWQILTKHCRNLRTITLDNEDATHFAKDARAFAAYGGFRQLVSRRGEESGPGLVDALIKVSDRLAGLHCARKHARASTDTGITDEDRVEAEEDVREAMKEGLEETNMYPALPFNTWDS
ncbi:uncharacterized protein BKCO1_1900022 [Diplodia corticola]|uniref:Uncharacterized protein n=1 Tax=Diplodia corticola TaxID=236234 RepID=A0A1J9R0T7_9PEZI|nr:uncharacterized protein BKCO1_1900022 [Diplodia corticola]OJD34990.1 hypothetical protein BKCO1_1900022 [Diplodia corticola]